MAKLPDPSTLDWGSMSKAEFKRTELAYELADEDNVVSRSKRFAPIPTKYPLQEVLAVAFAAHRINDGYTKDTRRFSEPGNKPVFANKDIVKMHFSPAWRPDDYEDVVITSEDYDNVNEAIKHFRSYSFKLLGEDLNDFQKSVFAIMQDKDLKKHQLGLAAYIPELVKRDLDENKFKKLLRTTYRDSEYVGNEKDNIDGVIKILQRTYSSRWESNNYVADYMGNIVSFMNKDVYAVNECYYIKAKVKSQSTNRLFEVKETRLNYVKVKNV